MEWIEIDMSEKRVPQNPLVNDHVPQKEVNPSFGFRKDLQETAMKLRVTTYQNHCFQD